MTCLWCTTYQAIVEENGIRVGLSCFERARIAARAVEQGVFETEKASLLSPFRTASRPKRSKIRSLLPLVAEFDGHLRFPHMIGERLGLKISAALETDPGSTETVRASPAATRTATVEAEQAVLAAALDAPRKPAQPRAQKSRIVSRNLRPSLRAVWEEEAGWLRLEG